MGVIEKIKEIEEEMARTQKNKATEYHLGLLKAKLARYRQQLLEPTTKSGPAGTGFDVQKSGDARVALIGFPSVGKAIPGVIEYKGARIQLLDLPGIVEGASQGRGRGRQVVSTAKTADLIVIMLDATKSEEQRRLLEIELDAVGIRLNKTKPDVVFKKKTTGGITFNTTVKLTKTDEKTIRTILAGYKLHNCDAMIREDITTDEFIDVLIDTDNDHEDVYNKIDSISLEQVDKLAHTPNTVVISCEMDLNLDYLIDRMWDELNIVKIFTKKRGAHPDLTDPAAAVEWFPKFKLRRIDALLLTHAHADAMNGLDDLRGWTLGKHSIQDHIDVYLTQATFREIQRSFPYLVSKEYASGGGDVPDFVYHIIEDGIPFEIEGTGVHVTPFSVHHGRIFSVLPCPAYTPTPNETGEAAPAEAMKKLHVNGSDTLKPPDTPQETVQPYFSLGFRIGDHIVYLSDVSHIPESAWPIILERKDDRPLPVCILDCLGLRRHTSHFGLDQTVEAARKIGAQRTYILGFSHAVSHDEYVTITEVLGGNTKDESSLSDIEKKGIELLGAGEAIWMRPAHDGLRVFIDEQLRDETYD
ncbi:metallo-beta-lactamase family protein [Moniliophthora roreri]|uniref:OBG-type G domain-containing protein n=1 Tax=Moniliophthora roreri TaxID=221103 RepID=A0A0W0FAS0_MONRR|nr:metallo-beta-lactamase family protein [Moniliophthora roreri]